MEQLTPVRNPDCQKLWIKALNSKSSKVRLAVATIMAGNPDPEIAKALVKRAKKEKEEDVRLQILRTLGGQASEDSVAALVKHAKQKKDPEAQITSVASLCRIGFQNPFAKEFLTGLLQSKDWKNRVLALGSAKTTAGPAELDLVVANLDHGIWQVRLAAVEALGAWRTKEAILPLIGRLEPEEERRIRTAILDALFHTTGVSIYDNQSLWMRWWEEQGKDLPIPAAIPVKPELPPDFSSAGFYGIPIHSEKVIFLIDQSGSMSADAEESEKYEGEKLSRLDVAIRETLSAVEKLKDSTLINVILFHTTIHPWQEELKELGENREDLDTYLRRQFPQGGTNIYDGLELAMQMEGVHTIYLLSDGIPGSGRFTDTQDILQAVAERNQFRRTVIHTIAIGMDSPLLRQLAEANGGSYVRR